jgi:hypothetical protein
MGNRSESPDSAQVRQWERGWEEHEVIQPKRMARLSLPEKIAWLEQAHRLVLHMKAASGVRPDEST